MASLGAVRRQVKSVLEQSARSIEHLHAPALRKMVPVLRHAQAEIESDLRAWLHRENGAELFTTQRYRNALVSLNGALDAARAVAPAVEDALWVGAEAAGHTSTANLTRELETFGRLFEGTIQPVNFDTAAILAAGDKVLWKQFATSAKTYAGSIGDGLAQEMAISRARGETIFELTNRLQKRMPAIFESDRWGAERLARTETISAYNTYHLEGIVQGAEEDPGLQARWDASFDWRRCPMCASLDGQVRDVASGAVFTAEWVTKTRKGLRGHRKSFKNAPAHPCCRCCITPWRLEWGMVSRARQSPPAAPALEELPIAARP